MENPFSNLAGPRRYMSEAAFCVIGILKNFAMLTLVLESPTKKNSNTGFSL